MTDLGLWLNLFIVFFYASGYRILYISDNHSRAHFLVLAPETVQVHDSLDAHADLLGDRGEGLSALHLIIYTLRGVHCLAHILRRVVVAASELAINHVVGVSAIANLSTFTRSHFRFMVIGSLIERVVVACHVLVAEIKEKSRVQGYSAEASLEMQVRARASASIAAETYWLARPHVLILGHELF